MQPFCSVFQQLLNCFPRREFAALVAQHQAERHARGFGSWDQFVAMLFCQLARVQSLSEICLGLRSACGKLVHLGVRAPSKSTLAYANEHRPWELYRSVFFRLLERCRQVAPRHRFRFKNKLLSIDTTVIDLCASMFDWAKFRRTKGAVKLHVVLDHSGHLPCFVQITEGKASDLQLARTVEFPAGAVVVFDRAYIDYRWFRRLTQRGVWFVTRTKRKMQYRVIEDHPVPKNRNVVRDQTVELIMADWYRFEPLKVRVVEILTDQGEPLEFLTNQFTFGATTIAEIYRQRWQIELLFKALKQNLRIKTFVGTSANALHTQIWTALIALVLARYLQFKARFGWCLSTLLAMLRLQLFTHRDLWKWLDDPGIGSLPAEPSPQLVLGY
jgi:IS4 transposase